MWTQVYTKIYLRPSGQHGYWKSTDKHQDFTSVEQLAVSLQNVVIIQERLPEVPALHIYVCMHTRTHTHTHEHTHTHTHTHAHTHTTHTHTHTHTHTQTTKRKKVTAIKEKWPSFLVGQQVVFCFVFGVVVFAYTCVQHAFFAVILAVPVIIRFAGTFWCQSIHMVKTIFDIYTYAFAPNIMWRPVHVKQCVLQLVTIPILILLWQSSKQNKSVLLSCLDATICLSVCLQAETTCAF